MKSFKPNTSVCRMEHGQLFTEFNVVAARQMSLSAEGELLKAREEDIRSFKAWLLLKEAEAAKAIRLGAEASNFEMLWILVGQLEKFQDDRMKIVEDKFDKLDTDFVEMALHLEEQFYPHLLTTISSHRWLLTYGIELAIAKCQNLPKYLSALETVIGKAIEKGIQDGLAVGITYGKEGRVLTDVTAQNPYAKADYIYALQKLQNIRENTANHISVLCDVFVSLFEPFSTSALTGVEGSSGTVPATATTMALSTTLASTSTVNPIFPDDYKFADVDDEAVAGRDDASFPNVDYAEFHIH
nr:hypothetical protein [Tanacetum cinerariifolium]